MRRLSILFLISFLGLHSHATAESHFEQIGDMYFDKHASEVKAEELEGLWSGRCFRWDYPNAPLAGVLIAAAFTDDVGPGLPSRIRRYTAVGVPQLLYSLPADYYDNPSAEVMNELQQYIDSGLTRDMLGESKYEKKRLVQDLNDRASHQAGWSRVVWGYARSGDYIVSNLRYIRHSGGIWDPGQARDAYRCYFFQKIQ